MEHAKNHTLSRALLSRFTDVNGKLIKTRCATGHTKLTAPGLEGFRKNLWTRGNAKKFEDLWNREAEADIKPVLVRLDAQQRLTLNDKKNRRQILCNPLCPE